MLALSSCWCLMMALTLHALPGIAAGKLPLCYTFLGCSLHASLALTFLDDDSSGHLLQSKYLHLLLYFTQTSSQSP